MSGVLSAVIAVLVLGSAGHVRAAEPAVSIDVDLSTLPRDEVTDALEAHLVEHQVEVLRDGGLEVADDSETRIRIVVTRYGKNDVHYLATVALFDEGASKAVAERTLTCELCRDSELVAKIGQEVARLSGRLLYATTQEEPSAEVTAAEPEPEPEHEESVVEPAEEPEKAEERRALGALGIGGIAALATGAVTTGVGVGLAVRPDEARVAGTRVELRSTRIPGLAMVGVGSALLVTGAVLVTLEGLRRKKRRPISMVPGVTPSRVTFGVQVGF